MKKSKKEEKKRATFSSVEWSEDAWQNWIGFWDLILKEDIRQNPSLYKKLKNNDRPRRTQKEIE